MNFIKNVFPCSRKKTCLHSAHSTSQVSESLLLCERMNDFFVGNAMGIFTRIPPGSEHTVHITYVEHPPRARQSVSPYLDVAYYLTVYFQVHFLVWSPCTCPWSASYTFVYVCLCAYLFMFLCLHVWAPAYLCALMNKWLLVCLCFLHMYVHVNVCKFICMCACA